VAYLLDANTFIEAKNLYYGMDFCPAYWDWLEHSNAAGRVYSIEKVQAELTAGADALATWAADRDHRFFLTPDAETLPAFAAVSGWANSAGYPPSAISTFLSVADYYLVAQALAHGYVVVTRELPGATKRIKIPDACIALGVSCVTPFEMLRAERTRFVLGDA
jgi:hypothetical protein